MAIGHDETREALHQTLLLMLVLWDREDASEALGSEVGLTIVDIATYLPDKSDQKAFLKAIAVEIGG